MKTTDDLVSEVRLKAWLPDADDLSSTEILSFAQDELLAAVSATIKVGHEEQGVEVLDVALAARVSIPRRAQGRAFRSLSWLSTAGEEVPAVFVPLAERWRYGAVSASTAPCPLILEGDEVVMLGAPPASGWSLRFRYVRRPPKLVLLAECRAIVAVPAPSFPALGALTCASAAPASFLVAGTILDLVRSGEPYGPRYDDLVVVSAADPTISFSSAVSSAVAATATGAEPDYLCPRDSSCFPPIPASMWPALVSATVGAIHEAQNNQAQASRSAERTAAALRSGKALLEPRKPSSAIVRRDSPLRRGGIGRWR